MDKKNFVVSDVSTESIASACRIMEENPSLSYEIVAEAVGINDRSNFKNSFVKFKGMSPNEWKQLQDRTSPASTVQESATPFGKVGEHSH